MRRPRLERTSLQLVMPPSHVSLPFLQVVCLRAAPLPGHVRGEAVGIDAQAHGLQAGGARQDPADHAEAE